MGFSPVEEFIGVQKWRRFETIRNQYAGHVTVNKVNRDHLGRILSPSVLGKAVQETGLLDLEGFIGRVQHELVPGIEKVRDEIFSQFPVAKEFVIKHALDVEKAISPNIGGEET